MVTWTNVPEGAGGASVVGQPHTSKPYAPTPIPTDAPGAPILAARAQPALRIPVGIMHWYGNATRHWLALVPWPQAEYSARLVEADTEAALAVRVQQLLSEAGRCRSFTSPGRR
ncbi:hypothetical protein [Actinomadura litoris]|uniref:hypothetical protein n=1 Tax=Actinomadura litoris TaxID=2678616 RepID=UPI001FA6DC8A|nr:hypothetical protein [Actinomadura litoris]